jgi:hypothetical protein
MAAYEAGKPGLNYGDLTEKIFIPCLYNALTGLLERHRHFLYIKDFCWGILV